MTKSDNYVTAGSGLRVGYDGRMYWFSKPKGVFRHSWLSHIPREQEKFRYALTQQVASQQGAQELIDQVGGPLARDPEEVEREKDLLRQAGIRVD